MLVRDETGTIRAIVGIAARDSASVLKTIQVGYARNSALTRRAIFGALSVTISPDSQFASGYSPGVAYPTTGLTTATPNGGTAPYTYAWSVDSGWSLTSSTNQSTRFGSVGLSPGDSSDATGTVIVTDANGIPATATVPLSASNNYGPI